MKPARKRELVDEVRTVWRVSIRRACHAFRSTDRPTTTGRNAPGRLF
jgi:hypothetical protein